MTALASGLMFVGAQPVHAANITSVTYNVEIKNGYSALCMDVTNQATWAGAPIQQWSCWGGANQVFDIYFFDDGSVAMKNHNSGMCITDPNAGVGYQVYQYPCAFDSSQRFYQRSAVYGYVNWQNVYDGLLLEDYNWSTSNGGVVDVWTSNGGGYNQMWIGTCPGC